MSVIKNKYYRPPLTEEQKKQQIEKANKKYCDLLTFGNGLVELRKDIHRNLETFNYSHENIVALVIAIIDTCHFRIGNMRYKNKNKSTGITTLEKTQLKLGKTQSTIAFKGKKQVENVCHIVEPVINSILLELVEENIDNNYVFSYKNESGEFIQITSNDINNFLDKYYLKNMQIAKNVSAKHFRTWQANTFFIDFIKDLEVPHNITSTKKNISTAIELTSKQLYHTKAICKRSYLDPRLINLYGENPQLFLELYGSIKTGSPQNFLSNNEQKLLGMLKHLCLVRT